MKKILLPEQSDNLKYYRANLHCHSTISDGKKTVEQLKEDYKAHGYSVVAFTDHNVFVPHNDLTDDSFLALNGFEIDISQEDEPEGESHKTCHLCMIALEHNKEEIVCYNRSDYVWGNACNYRSVQKFDENKPDFIRTYNPECINEIIKQGKENGFFVTYNHPTWSLESYPQYSCYEGMDAMEIENFGCVIVGYDDDNGHCYEDLLRQGKRLYCIAADDNHNNHPDSDPGCDSYGGYTMIAAPSLNYEDITSALKNGMFYASTGNYKNSGPEIKSIVFEDGKVTIKTSPARSICCMQNIRLCRNCEAPDGETVTEAVFNIDGDAKWFRFTVTDNKGYKAYSNAYFTEQI